VIGTTKELPVASVPFSTAEAGRTCKRERTMVRLQILFTIQG